jgi:HEPN domain-containing protein
MPRSPGSPEDWLRYARSDLAIAAQPLPPDALYETLAYHAQQSVEKSLKAILIYSGVQFPYTHNIARLITAIQDAGVSWPKDLDKAAELTEYAVELRYPSAVHAVTKNDQREAVEIAKKVLSWAENIIY